MRLKGEQVCTEHTRGRWSVQGQELVRQRAFDYSAEKSCLGGKSMHLLDAYSTQVRGTDAHLDIKIKLCIL